MTPAPTAPPRQPGKPWTYPEAAEFLTVSVRHLQALAARGEINVQRIGRRVVLSDRTVRYLAGE
jgi:excisionase family DNA binding protein